jgi:hypothetical protein
MISEPRNYETLDSRVRVVSRVEVEVDEMRTNRKLLEERKLNKVANVSWYLKSFSFC